MRLRVAPLDRKLLRELWRLRGQMLSIATVVAAAVLMLVTMRGGYEALVRAQADYYALTRFPDLWATVDRAPDALLRRLETIDGVAAVESRVSAGARLDLPDLDEPGSGLFVSLPDEGRPLLSDVVIRAGRLPAPGARDEVLAGENFAAARGMVPGDTLRAILNGRRRSLVVVGTAISPEHTYSVPAGSLFPDDERYGVFWMRRSVLGSIFDMEGGFNEAVFRLSPGADPAAATVRIDRALEAYGGRGAFPRADQFSHQTIEGEFQQNRVMGTAFPVVFLSVAAFLLHLVMSRLIATQRTEIAVLKAFGYRDREVGWHFLRFALASIVIGAGAGGLAGSWLGGAYVELYATYFDFPTLEYRLSLPLVLLGGGVSAVAAVVGALGAVRRAAGLPPAEAMRAEPPPRFEPGPLERLGVGAALPPAGRMILRNLERRPLQAALSALGVAFSVAILVLGLFTFDGVDRMIAIQFDGIQREDVAVTFREPLSANVRFALERLEGVDRVELQRTVAARLRAGHRKREVGLQGLPFDGRLRRIVDADGSVRPVPADGVVLSAILAERLRVGVGDTLDVEALEGRRARGRVAVAGVVDDFLGVSAIMSLDALEAFTGEGPLVSGAWLSVSGDRLPEVHRSLEGLPSVAGVASPSQVLDLLEEQLSESLLVGIAFIVGFAGVISVAVIYNGARIALSERGRELASLRVMGFRRSEVSVLLLGEQAIVTLLAIPVGWAIGYAMSFGIAEGFRTESYRIPLVISFRTYAFAAVVTVIAAAASGWIVRRRVDRLDLVEVLKTRE
ncbi:FtsX-like permease family protein [Gemmatimonadota bacterium Y43]|uniref:ABC transporter permease n=1 Tax=Gaopeijia maritima TaxID=3119007 RepID=UPI003293EB4E